MTGFQDFWKRKCINNHASFHSFLTFQAISLKNSVFEKPVYSLHGPNVLIPLGFACCVCYYYTFQQQMLRQNMVVYEEECPISEFIMLCRCVFILTHCLLLGITYWVVLMESPARISWEYDEDSSQEGCVVCVNRGMYMCLCGWGCVYLRIWQCTSSFDQVT